MDRHRERRGGRGEREREEVKERRERGKRERRERHTHREKRGERVGGGGGMECGRLAPAQRQTKHWLGGSIIADQSRAQQFISTDNTHKALFFG